MEIVGAGRAHNDSSSALEMIYRTPILDHVNVTNSSMHAVHILAPRNKVCFIYFINNIGSTDKFVLSFFVSIEHLYFVTQENRENFFS